MITFGTGEKCERVNPSKSKPLSPVHLHCDSKGVVVAFYGAQDACHDYRKARTAAALRRGETV